MQQKTILDRLWALWGIKGEFKAKVLLLSTTFLLMSSCLVIWRPLKIAIFSKMVGPTFIPSAKIYSLFILIPLILLYSKLVDWLKKHQLLYCFAIAHGIGGLIFAYLLADPVYGIANTQATPDRWLGWIFYCFMESFDAFFSTSFWSFADSVNNPSDAKYYYGFYVIGSKIGGITAAGLLYCLLSNSSSFTEALMLPSALAVGSALLFAAAVSIYYLIKIVPEGKMHGYEQAYQLDKHKESSDKKSLLENMKAPFEGLRLMLKFPYVLGIFSMVVFYEVIIVMVDYYVALQAHDAHPTVSGMTGFYAQYYFFMNLIGLGIAFLGTTPMLRIFGIRYSLFVFPLLCLMILTVPFLFPIPWILTATLIGLRALNYALNHPTREALYIPTTNAIKFKAKTWTDAFGSRIAKSTGSVINLSLGVLDKSVALMSSISLSIGLTTLWIVVTYFLGRTLQNALDKKLVIGENTGSTENQLDS